MKRNKKVFKKERMKEIVEKIGIKSVKKIEMNEIEIFLKKE